MIKVEITPSLVEKYTKDKYVDKNTHKIKEMHEAMLIHSDGVFPTKLVGERRPNESDTLLKYREKIYEPQTVSPFSKILNSLGKIRRSEDWSIAYREQPKKVLEADSLKMYCETKFPLYESVTNWMFSICLKQYLVDPNGVIAVMPKHVEIEDGDYVEPIPYIYNSEQILDYKENELAVLESKEKNIFVEKGTVYEGKILYFITNTEIWISKEVNSKGDFETNPHYVHNLGFLPVRKIKAEFKEQVNNYVIYKSKLSACLPSWNEAVREYSDMQASVVTHLFPTLVVHTNQQCTKCNGFGKSTQKDGKTSECKTCGGKGYMPTSPYQNIEVRPQKATEQPLPSPIAYYIDKDTDIIRIQDERIDKHIYKGYAAVNFEFLATQLNQSGVAKELDRGELNSFIYDIAEGLINIMDWVYNCINEYRYNVVLSESERRAQLPNINVPSRYDIVSESYLIEEISKAKTNKLNQFIINELELQFANKKFNASPEIKDFVKASIELDPLSGLNEDDKMVRASNRVIAKEDYIISTYISTFIRMAINENKEFLSQPYEVKLSKLREYAKRLNTDMEVNDAEGQQ